MMVWTTLDTWIVVAGALAGASCALIGSFLVLKKISMMGDAISHAVLPGIAVAFILTASRSAGVMFIGAAVVGVFTAVLVQWVRQFGKLEQGASMGVVFTVMFAVGLILIEQAARHVDIHPEHVLYGAVELVPLYLVTIGGVILPRGVAILSAMLLVNVIVVILLFKEWRLTTFDPELATTLGINATWMHYLLMTLTALTTVAAFEVVGSILVIAMLIVPGAIAHLLTRRLVSFLVVSVVIAVLAAVLGHLAAITVPPMFGFEDTSTSGSMATVLGVLFLVTLMVAPEQGVLARVVKAAQLRLSIATQDVLGLLARAAEKPEPVDMSLSRKELMTVDRSPFANRGLGLLVSLGALRMRGLVIAHGGRYRATNRGAVQGRGILRSHRLWERFFYDDGQVELRELHNAADYLEHYTDPQLQQDLAERFAGQPTDPRGNPIPDTRIAENRSRGPRTPGNKA